MDGGNLSDELTRTRSQQRVRLVSHRWERSRNREQNCVPHAGQTPEAGAKLRCSHFTLCLMRRWEPSDLEVGNRCEHSGQTCARANGSSAGPALGTVSAAESAKWIMLIAAIHLPGSSMMNFHHEFESTGSGKLEQVAIMERIRRMSSKTSVTQGSGFPL